MKQKSKPFSIKIWGENACFTRPEMKVERVSYDVMTPSAARGIVEAILWKPAIAWEIVSISLLKPIRWESVRRNEVKSKIPLSNITSAMAAGSGNLELIAVEDRTQRAGLFLRDVAYIIEARFSLTERKGELDSVEKFEAMFERRLRKGQCHHQPVLGCREFVAYFCEPGPEDQPIHEFKDDPKDLGWMLFDMDFSSSQGSILPRFFRAEISKGTVRIPQELYQIEARL